MLDLFLSIGTIDRNQTAVGIKIVFHEIAGRKFGRVSFRSGRQHFDDFIRIDHVRAGACGRPSGRIQPAVLSGCSLLAGRKVMSRPAPPGLEMRTTMSRTSPVSGLGMRARTTTCSNPRPSVDGASLCTISCNSSRLEIERRPHVKAVSGSSGAAPGSGAAATGTAGCRPPLP